MSVFNEKIHGNLIEDSSVKSVFYGAKTVLLEDELNESQWSQIEHLKDFVKSQFNNGLLNNFDITIETDNVFSVKTTNGEPFNFILDGQILKYGYNLPQNLAGTFTPSKDKIIIELPPTEPQLRTDLVYLEVWFEVMSHNEKIRLYGGSDTPELDNSSWFDHRVNRETARRVQMKWRLAVAPGKTTLQDLEAKNYDGSTQSNVKYSLKEGVYYAKFDPSYFNGNGLKTTGEMVAIPLFNVNRKINNNKVDLNEIIDITPKAVHQKDSNLLESIDRRIFNISKRTLSIPRANRVGFIGDSNTHNTGRNNTEISKPVWPALVGVMSDMKIYTGLNAAVSGYTTKNALSEQVDRIIADNPSKCIVMIGTNDIGLKNTGINFPTESMDNVVQIANKLALANIEPIFMTVYPITEGSTLGGNLVEDVHNKVNLFNQFLKRFCAEQGYQCLDTYSLLVNPVNGNMSSYSNDGVHTGTWLAYWVAEYVVQQIAHKFPAWKPQLCESNNDPTNLLTNPLFINDSNADGVPDEWIKTGNSLNTSIDPGIDVFGKWATISSNSYQPSGVTLSQNVTNGFTAGDTIAIGGRIKALVKNREGSTYSCKVMFNGAAQPLYSPMFEFRCTIDGSFYQEYQVPAGTTSITVEIGAANGFGKFQFGQMTLKNLTRLGVI